MLAMIFQTRDRCASVRGAGRVLSNPPRRPPTADMTPGSAGSRPEQSSLFSTALLAFRAPERPTRRGVP